MACEILILDSTVFALWGKPTKGDLDRVLSTVEQQAQSAGHPVVYIARIPQDAPAPEGEVRAHMNALMPRFIKSCSSYHALLEGSGFVSAIKRAVLAGLLQFGFPKGTFFVHDDKKRIFEKVSVAQRPKIEAILELAARKGLL